MGQKGLLDIIGVTHAGMNAEAFEGIVTNWISTVIHPAKTGTITHGLRRQKRVDVISMKEDWASIFAPSLCASIGAPPCARAVRQTGYSDDRCEVRNPARGCGHDPFGDCRAGRGFVKMDAIKFPLTSFFQA